MTTAAPVSGFDQIDQGIVTCLRANARSTFAEIGEVVGLSAPAVKRRVDRLVDSGAISGFTAIIDPHALGWHTEAYVEVYCSGKVPPQVLREQFSAIVEVTEACTVSGAADAILHVLARDVQHLEQTIQRIRGSADVTNTRTEIVLSRLFHRSAEQSAAP